MADPREPGAGHVWEPDLHLANDRIADRQREARDTRAVARTRTGPIERLRTAIGARLIAIGTNLAAPERPMVRRPVRRP